MSESLVAAGNRCFIDVKVTCLAIKYGLPKQQQTINNQLITTNNQFLYIYFAKLIEKIGTLFLVNFVTDFFEIKSYLINQTTSRI